MLSKEAREALRSQEGAVREYLENKGKILQEADSIRRNSNVAVLAARENVFLQQLQGSMKTFLKDIPALKKVQTAKSKGPSKRILNVTLSDLHYGALLDHREVGHRYGAKEEARRTAAVVKQVSDYKRQYRKETELYVHLIGDIIQGQLHDPRDGAPLADQMNASIAILTQAIRHLASEFPKGVTVMCTPGNHGRNTARHKQRAIFQKFDSNETVIYFALKTVVEHAGWKNVQVLMNKEPKYTYEAFNKRGFMTHGDTVLNPGYPGKAINVSSLTTQTNAINAAELNGNRKGFSLFSMGHVHTGAIVHVPNAIVMTNGCLIPPDSFANSIGIFDCSCGQWVFESVPDYIVGDNRFVRVDFDTDKDASLDSIIQPYKDY